MPKDFPKRAIGALKSSLNRFSRDEEGVIAILFALLLVPMLGLVLGGIDYSRAMSVQSQFQTAADAAANTAASRLLEGRDTAEQAFKVAFQENLPDELKDHPYNLAIAKDGSEIRVDIKASVKTTLISFLGLEKLDVAANTVAKPPVAGILGRGIAGLPGAGNSPLDALGDGPAAARVRRQVERAMGGAGVGLKTRHNPADLAAAQRQAQEMARRYGGGVSSAPPPEIDPAELERMQHRIMQELRSLGNLRF